MKASARARTLQLWMWLVDLSYSFKCDLLTELVCDNKLSNNKLPDNSLASELAKNRSFVNQL